MVRAILALLLVVLAVFLLRTAFLMSPLAPAETGSQSSREAAGSQNRRGPADSQSRRGPADNQGRRKPTGNQSGRESAGNMRVRAARIRRTESYRVERSYWGQIVPQRDIQAGFRIGGLISKIHVDLGDSFAAEQVLAELNDAQADAQVRVLQSQLEVAQQNLLLAEESLQRLSAVDEAGFSTDETMQTAGRNVQIRSAQVNAAARLLQQAGESLADHRLRAPWSGRVQQRMLDEGAVVAPGTALLHLIEGGRLEMRVGLPHDLAASLNANHKQVLHLGDEQVQVSLSRLAPATSQASRTRQAIFALPPGVGAPGQGAELRLGVVFRRPGYWVPVQSLSQLRKGLWGLVVLENADAQGRADIGQRIVEILHIDNERAYVDGALKPGELVVVSAVAELVAGQRVHFGDRQ